LDFGIVSCIFIDDAISGIIPYFCLLSYGNMCNEESHMFGTTEQFRRCTCFSCYCSYSHSTSFL